jgi:cell pole-organizing protein PopZ
MPPPLPPPPAASSAVLELTDMIADDGKVVSLKAPPPPPAPPQPSAPAVTNGSANLPAATKAVTALQDLQSAARQAAVSDAMLVPVGNLGRAFEDLVREQLKPMLQTWIDQNLPSVIERQVQKEIERISRQASER